MNDNALWETFTTPPDEARPHAWWHWMDGNIDPVGIERDLRWLHFVGVRGVHMFDGGMGGELVVPHPVRPGSPAWAEAVEVAVQTTAELGMELAVATSSGWSAAGAPWVDEADAMKKLVWSHEIIDGGAVIDRSLPPLPSCAGMFQDAPLWNGSTEARSSSTWRVLAIPHDPRHDPLIADDVSASAPIQDARILSDGSFASGVELPRDPEALSSAWIEQSFRESVTVRSVQLGLPGPTGFGAAPPPDARLEALGDDDEWHVVTELPGTPIPARSATFPPVTARRFRLVLTAASAADAVPPQAPGVRRPPVLRTVDRFVVTEFALREGARVHAAETKAGFGVEADYYRVDGPPVSDGAVRASDVIDVTEHVHDGRLRWDAPPGAWRILHLGGSLTGKTNGPAPADATGLEIDKLDGRRVEAYLHRHLERFGTPDGSGRWITGILSDSIESGPQNFTEEMAEHFLRLRGYDPAPWWPALAGFIVDDPASTDRFLYDHRRTIAELLASEYYGTITRIAHELGLEYYAEALEDQRPQLGDDLAMRAHADIPMGAAWTFDPDEGAKPTYVADLKGASSVAHVHGRRHTGAEAFTSFDNPWGSTPRTLKHVADLQLALGVTRFCIHTSAHQPVAAPPPGVSLAPFLGQTFTVNETWAPLAGPWVDYLARCSAMLSAGEPDVDLAVFIGEEAPVTGLYGERLDDTVPADLDFDYVGPDALRDVLHVADGELRSRGARYRALVLGGSSRRMSIAALREVERLLDAGATVIGDPPDCSPSLADDPEDFAALRNRLWRDGGVASGPVGEALESLGILPWATIDGAPVRRIARRMGALRTLFVANPAASAVRVRLRTVDPGPLSLWDPVMVTRRPLRADGGDDVVIDLEPHGSVFIVTGSDAPSTRLSSAELEGIELAGGREFTGDWTLQLPGIGEYALPDGPRPWTDLGDAERGFSGIGVYRHDFTLDDVDGCAELEIADVRDVAGVVVNGVECGVAWAAPFRVAVGHALRVGGNRLELHVATPWRNRLIAEASAPSGMMLAATTTVFEADAAHLEAGISGPATLYQRR